MIEVKSNCSSYPFQCLQTHILFVSMACWNFSTGYLVLLFVDDHQRPCFSGTPGLQRKGARASSQATDKSTAGTNVHMPITCAWMGKTVPRICGIWYWVPELLQRHSGGRLNCCWERDTNERDLIQP